MVLWFLCLCAYVAPPLLYNKLHAVSTRVWRAVLFPEHLLENCSRWSGRGANCALLWLLVQTCIWKVYGQINVPSL